MREKKTEISCKRRTPDLLHSDTLKVLIDFFVVAFSCLINFFSLIV